MTMLSNKTIFLKSWLWSLIGAAAIVFLFWLISDFIHVPKKLNSLTGFTDTILCLSVLGNIIGSGLVVWRIAEKYHTPIAKNIIRKYFWLSLWSFILATILIITGTPLTTLIVVWNLIAPICVLRALPTAVAKTHS
jgi:hypothetical protein